VCWLVSPRSIFWRSRRFEEKQREAPVRQEEFRKLTPDAKLAQLRGSKSERRFHIERKAIDETARTVWLSIASEQPYERWWGIEILSLEPGARCAPSGWQAERRSS
jgi:hypothetical protein